MQQDAHILSRLRVRTALLLLTQHSPSRDKCPCSYLTTILNFVRYFAGRARRCSEATTNSMFLFATITEADIDMVIDAVDGAFNALRPPRLERLKGPWILALFLRDKSDEY
jgi:hypothetical protein